MTSLLSRDAIVARLTSLKRRFATALVSPFVIPSSTGANVPSLDGLRGVAVLLVVVYHSWALSNGADIAVSLPYTDITLRLRPFLSNAYVGVDLFFVLSGFLLPQYWFYADYQSRPRPPVTRYFRHRIFRIAPAYYFYLLATLIFFWPTGVLDRALSARETLFNTGNHLLFLHYLHPLTIVWDAYNGSLWTLTIEALFYVTLPWTVILFLRNRWLVTLPVSIALTTAWLYLSRNGFDPLVASLLRSLAPYEVTEFDVRFHLSRQFPAQLAEFGFGIALANLYVRYQLGERTARWWRMLTDPKLSGVYFAGGWAMVLFWMYGTREHGLLPPYLYSRVLFVAGGFTLILAGLLLPATWPARLYSFAPLRAIGLIGYSIYLWHMPVIRWLKTFPTSIGLPAPQAFTHLLLYTVITVTLLGAFLYLTIEKPFLLIGRRQPARATDPPATVTPRTPGLETARGRAK